MNPRLPFSAFPGFFSPDTSHVIAALNSEPRAEPVTCDMQCDPGRSLTGTVVDPAGRPIAGVWAHGLRPVPSTRHPALESHEFQAVSLDPQHPRRLYFFHEGRALAGSVVVKGEEPGPIVVKLQPQGDITGRIVDDAGQPKTRLELLSFVEPELDPRRGDILLEFWTDPEGRFRLVVVPGLEYEATAMTEQPPRKTTPVFEAEKVGPSEIRDLGDLRFKKPPSQ